MAFAISELSKYLKEIDKDLFVEVLLLDEPDAACGDVVWVGLHDSFKVPKWQTPIWMMPSASAWKTATAISPAPTSAVS